MGNSKNNKKGSKKRKLSNKSKRTSSEQKENVPKIKETKKTTTSIKIPYVNCGIEMSKQLLLKKSNVCSRKRSSSKNERTCPDGKPMPSLSELEEMFKDSDDDDDTSKTSSSTPVTTSVIEKTPISENNLSSLTNITKHIMGRIISNKLPDPEDVLEATSLLTEQSPPHPPVIPPKKRKIPEIPYIVVCKDGPKAVGQPKISFCNGDEGVEGSHEQQEEQPETKQAKNSEIPQYSNSIFNARSEETAETLTKDNTGEMSDASSDSNKTIEYDPTQYQHTRPHSFSPLPSTSRDNETFIKNDQLFSESLKENQVTKELPVNKVKDELVIMDIPQETIVIDDVIESEKDQNNNMDTDVIEINGSNTLHQDHIPNDVECISVSSPTISNLPKNCKQPIVIDDEYSSINTDLSYNNEIIEIVDDDLDDIMAGNKSLFDKWKNNEGNNFNKINTVVDVPTTNRKSTTSKNLAQTPSIVISHTDDHVRDNQEPNIGNQQTQTISNSSTLALNTILDDFFTETSQRRGISLTDSQREGVSKFFQSIVKTLKPSSIKKKTPSKYCINAKLNISTHKSQIPKDKQSESGPPSSTSTNTTPPPVPSRNLGDCPICLDPLSTTNGIASTICGHVFCLKCIQAAIKSSGKKCPTCRKALKGAGGGYHQIYL